MPETNSNTSTFLLSTKSIVYYQGDHESGVPDISEPCSSMVIENDSSEGGNGKLTERQQLILGSIERAGRDGIQLQELSNGNLDGVLISDLQVLAARGLVDRVLEGNLRSFRHTKFRPRPSSILPS